MDTNEVENAAEQLRRQLNTRPYGNAPHAVNNHYVSWTRANAIECTLDSLRNHPNSFRLAFSCVSSLRLLASARWSRYFMPYSGATKVINHGGIVAILHAMATFNNAGCGPFDPG